MTILLTGGGSGGHITPLLAVADEIKRRNPHTKVVYLGQKGDGLIDIPRAHGSIDEVHEVSAGKLRRYHGLGIKQFMNVKTNALNLRDAFRVVNGTQQSYRLLKKIKPNLIFVKGGYVGVPIGLAAARLRIPFVTHDSDAIPGLANRIIARWASAHAVSMKPELYPYPTANTHEVGVPVSSDFKPVTVALRRQYRSELNLPVAGPILFITGGGLGAQRVNFALLKIAPELFKRYPGLTLIHNTGRLHEKEMQQKYAEAIPNKANQIIVKGFVKDMYRYSGAADVVIARAGATTIAELAQQGVATILVPNPVLTGGQQLKNAAVLIHSNAVISVDDTKVEADPSQLLSPISDLLASPSHRSRLGSNLRTFAHPDATTRLVDVLFDTLEKSKT